ncbi:MAG: MFS transporter [Oscillospiraceae bacterium]|nr:MFS transporter [Oscillospiraceae bacterium]
MKHDTLQHRWGFLILGTAALLFAGVIYAWSILKTPLGEAFGWTGKELALNYTLTMWCFCLGGFGGGLLGKRLGSRVCLLLAALLAGGGFILASRLTGGSVVLLYLCYGGMGGLGIGLAYNVIISTVNRWFPDKKGLCSGTLMMGFGASALVVGKLAAALMEGPGWQTAYLCIGIALGVVLGLTALFLRAPGPDTVLPAAATRRGRSDDVEALECTTGQMLRRPSFWLAFFCIVCLSAVGSTVFSFAKDLSVSTGANADFATTLVGVLSICNGLGRILIGSLFDKLGRKKTMLAANLLTVLAAGTTLLAAVLHSLPLCVAGLCLTGFSYGSSPTISSAFTAAFYGSKYFPLNFSVMNFNLIPAALTATAAGGMLEATGGFTAPLALLSGLALVSLVLSLLIRKP